MCKLTSQIPQRRGFEFTAWASAWCFHVGCCFQWGVFVVVASAGGGGWLVGWLLVVAAVVL